MGYPDGVDVTAILGIEAMMSVFKLSFKVRSKSDQKIYNFYLTLFCQIFVDTPKTHRRDVINSLGGFFCRSMDRTSYKRFATKAFKNHILKIVLPDILNKKAA